jgi:murein DD-endopeptidase MepM/ murein hydrolase activator NlpD
MNSKKESVAASKGIGAFMKKRKLQIGVMTIICLALTFNLAFAEDPTTESTTEEIFHIYNDEEYIGAVTDEQTIDTLIATKKEEASTQYEDYTIDAGTNITVVPEQVFTVAVDEKQALQTLEQSIAIEAKAMAFVVGGQTVAYVKDEADFNETIRQLKLLFVTEQQLNTLNASNNTNVPPLQDNETRVKSINIKENVAAEETMIDPEQIVEPKQLAKQLIEGGKVTKNYPVQEGDTVNSVAASYGLTVNELLKSNSNLTEHSKLSTGDTLTVEVVRPNVNVEVQYEALKVRTVGHKTIVKQSDSLLKGTTEVEQQGKDGKREIVLLLTEVNGGQPSKQTLSNEVVVEPVDEVEVIGTKEIPHVGTGTFAWPAVGGYVSSKMGPRWGRNHDGIDIARPSDYTIKASDNGKVTFTGPDGTYGNKVVVSHNNGYETVYAHLASISVSVGQTVAQGQKLGIMGNTGRSTGIHLHFEVYKNGALINPLSVLNR